MQRVALVILLCVVLFSSQASVDFNTLRWLQASTFNSTAKEQACANIPKNYTGVKLFDNVNAYVQSLNLTNGNSAGQRFLINLLLHGSTSDLKSWLSEISIYLAMMALGIIALISKYYNYINSLLAWPFLLCCCCCNCCLFNDNMKKGWCGFIYLVLALCCLSLIIITAIIGLAQSQYDTYIINLISE